MRKQGEMILSEYSGLYDIVVPKDNELRKLKELVDFSFIYDELTTNYSINHGTIDPIRMFKDLLLKVTYNLYDVDIVKKSQYDMSFKYFLDMAPEEDIINPSSLTKFRRLRLKNINLLDMLIHKSVSIAKEHKLLKSDTLILYVTRSQCRYNIYSTKQLLNRRNNQVKKSISKILNIETETPKFDDISTEESVEKSRSLLKKIKGK
ncbi:transposase [Macrococcus epidermidis]|uniref:transposase n=1 Tax=Macrococcus epidermidis TaxID=1902580 RepID=UPI0020B70032|nr:transposase [Macrococcus epidermidis]UTH15998.1 transposase [Macrococcus epidermidis]